MVDSDWLLIDEVAAYLRVKPRTVRAWIDRGLLVSTCPGGGRRLVSRASMMALVERQIDAAIRRAE